MLGFGEFLGPFPYGSLDVGGGHSRKHDVLEFSLLGVMPPMAPSRWCDNLVLTKVNEKVIVFLLQL